MEITPVPRRWVPAPESFKPLSSEGIELLRQLCKVLPAMRGRIAEGVRDRAPRTFPNRPFTAELPGSHSRAAREEALAMFHHLLVRSGQVRVPGTRIKEKGLGLIEALPVLADDGAERSLIVDMRWSDCVRGVADGVVRRSDNVERAQIALANLADKFETTLEYFLAAPPRMSGRKIAHLFDDVCKGNVSEFARKLRRHLSPGLVSASAATQATRKRDAASRGLTSSILETLTLLEPYLDRFYEQGKSSLTCNLIFAEATTLGALNMFTWLGPEMTQQSEPRLMFVLPQRGPFTRGLVQRAIAGATHVLETAGFWSARGPIRFNYVGTHGALAAPGGIEARTHLHLMAGWTLALDWSRRPVELLNDVAYARWVSGNLAAHRICARINAHGGENQLERLIFGASPKGGKPPQMTAAEFVDWADHTLEGEDMFSQPGHMLVRALKKFLDERGAIFPGAPPPPPPIPWG